MIEGKQNGYSINGQSTKVSWLGVGWCSTIALRLSSTVFDTSVSFTFFSKTLDPLVNKNGSMQVNNTNFGFLIV